MITVMINTEKVSVLMEFTFSYRKQIIKYAQINNKSYDENRVMGFRLTVLHTVTVIFREMFYWKVTYEQVSQ